MYKQRVKSRSMQHIGQSRYLDYLKKLNDEELKLEYQKVNSHINNSSHKMILNRFLLDNDKMDIVR